MILYHSRLRLSTPFFNFFEVFFDFFVVAISERLLFPVFPMRRNGYPVFRGSGALGAIPTLHRSVVLFSFPFPKLAAAFSREAAQESGEIMRVFESEGLCDSG